MVMIKSLSSTLAILGVPGATGSQTTWYNIQSQGDPNEKVSGI